MPSTYVDLVKVSTSTTGTGTVTLGAAVTGYRGASALTSGASYSYSIADTGGGYEIGVGTYSAGTLTRVVTESSNSNSAISLSGNAQVAFIVSAADLTSMNVPAWPFFKGASTTSASVGYGAFTTLAVTSVTDTHGGWNASTNYYTFPQSGTYQIFGKYRVADSSAAGGTGIGIFTSPGDNADFFWGQTNQGGTRNGVQNSRTDYWTAGQSVCLYCYLDNAYTVIETALVILRVR